ncbi:MAG: 3-oxoadipate CoA-transferase subunit A [Dehalococcoidia bacterium]|jgi:3-oxoadipate CoA-transferase alpha subunit|nr:MAG: 3-oxoadipate CoA-transferase subunit A [Dehalococcoidia bacterium]
MIVVPVLTPDEAVADIPNGASIMIGGFAGGGQPFELVRALARHGARDLTIITNNISVHDNTDLLAQHGLIRKAIASFPVPASEAANTALERQFKAGLIEVESVPQGTLVERIRAGGAGLGGFYTPTGVGTRAAEGKEVRVIDGREYLFELPLRADYALIRAAQADTMGNLVYRGTARNFNPVMATAADIVICQVEELVPAGVLDPERIGTPGIFVDRLCIVARE